MDEVEFDAVLFDAGGVLLLPDPTILAAVLAPYGGSSDPETHRRAHYAAMRAKSAAGHLETEWGAYEYEYVLRVGVHERFVEHAAEVLDSIRSPHLWRHPIDEARAALAALHAQQVPMGVVSNASGQVEAELARQGLCQVGEGPGTPMRAIIDSYVVGVAKPDPAIFDFALAEFGDVDRQRIVFIGDSVTMDVGGAAAAGLRPVLIDPYDDHTHYDIERIASLGALVAAADARR